MDFTTISQDPTIRAVVQSGMLERAFHDALFPKTLFRGEAKEEKWPENVGDSMIFTAPGLIPVDMTPLTPGVDPTPASYPVEQWETALLPYGRTIDTYMPNSIVAIANLFLRNSHQLGLNAAQTLNRIVRNRMYNAALAGNTVADSAGGGAQSGTSLRVKRLNGFTTARRPDLVAGSPVRFNAVSASNPLKITLFDNGAEVANTVVGFTPDTSGDEFGPGVLLLGTATTSVADRAYVLADDGTALVRVGGGKKVDSVTSNSLLRLADIRSAVSTFWQQNVPEHPDGRFHCHLDPTSQAQVFSDPEWQRLLTSLPDYYMYKQFSIGELLGTVFFRNSECPQVDTVTRTNNDGITFSQKDNFTGELYNNGVKATGVQVHRPLFTAQGGIFEYYQDLAALITEAGVTGKVGTFRLNNNGIDVFADRIQLIIRAPLNRTQDQVASTWKFNGDWPVRTDACVGGAARIKRFLVIEHGA